MGFNHEQGFDGIFKADLWSLMDIVEGIFQRNLSTCYRKSVRRISPYGLMTNTQHIFSRGPPNTQIQDEKIYGKSLQMMQEDASHSSMGKQTVV